jgi:hypothetical protein
MISGQRSRTPELGIHSIQIALFGQHLAPVKDYVCFTYHWPKGDWQSPRPAYIANFRYLTRNSLPDGQTRSNDRAEHEFEAERRRTVEHQLYVDKNADEEALKLQQGWSLMRALVDDVTTAAMTHALQARKSLDEFKSLAFAGVAVVDSLQYGLQKKPWDDKSDLRKQWNFWQHEREHPVTLIKAKKQPYINRSSVESAAAEYLNLPYRSARLERLLVDVLVALELYAFSDEMLTPPDRYLRWIPTRSPLHQKHVARGYIIGQLLSAVILLGGAWLAVNAAWNATATVLFVLFLADLVLATIGLRFAWRKQSKSRGEVWKCIKAMTDTY